MKTNSLVLSLVVSSLSVFSIVSCNQMPASGENEVKTEQNSTIVASLDFGSEGSVEFIEPEPGLLITSATFPSIDAMAPYKDLNAVELYEALSGSDAPASLVTAYRKAKEAAKTESNEPPPPDFKDDELVTEENSDALAKTQMSANEFAIAYCMGIGICDFGTCVGDANGYSSYYKWGAEWYNHVHAKQGNVFHTVQRWNSNLRRWEYVKAVWIYQGQTHSYSLTGTTRYYKASVSYAASSTYHYAYMGYEVAR